MFAAPSQLRASDEDRERTVAFLNGHCAQGRLTVDELSVRADAAYRAVAVRDLEALIGDLPGSPFAPVPALRRPRGGLVTGLGLGAVLVGAMIVAVLSALPAAVWAPLLLLTTAAVVLMLFAILPIAVPALLIAWLVRTIVTRDRRADRSLAASLPPAAWPR